MDKRWDSLFLMDFEWFKVTVAIDSRMRFQANYDESAQLTM